MAWVSSLNRHCMASNILKSNLSLSTWLVIFPFIRKEFAEQREIKRKDIKNSQSQLSRLNSFFLSFEKGEPLLTGGKIKYQIKGWIMKRMSNTISWPWRRITNIRYFHIHPFIHIYIHIEETRGYQWNRYKPLLMISCRDGEL